MTVATTGNDDADDARIEETTDFGDYQIVDVVWPIVPRAMTDVEYAAASDYLSFVAKCESSSKPSLIFTHLCRLMGEVAHQRAAVKP